MVKTRLREDNRLAAIQHDDASAGFDRADARHSHAKPSGARRDFGAQRGGRGECQLVVIAARQSRLTQERMLAVAYRYR